MTPSLKNGIKCIFRTPGKTALFALILAVLSALTAVSFTGFSAVSGYIRDADEYYHTVAELEFTGEEYPERTVYDPMLSDAVKANAEELDALKNDPAVISFEPDVPYIALIDGLSRKDDYVYNPYSAVLALYIMESDESGTVLTAIVSKTFYALKNLDNKLITVYMSGGAGEGEKPEKGKTYVMSGSFSSGFGNLVFRQKPIAFEDINGFAKTPDLEWITSHALDENDPFKRLTEVLKLQNNSCRVTYTNSIGDLPPFHQQQMKLSSGRFFTEEEYASSAHAAIVSDKISGALGLKVGDKLDMRVFSSEDDVYRIASLSEEDAGEYEIIGIFADVDSYPNWIFLPGLSETSFVPTTGYSLGSFRIDNSRAAAFERKAQSLSEKGFRLTVYDQGYSAATEPMRELLLIASIFLAVCLLLTFAALILHCYVFVSRQKETAVTMRKLGSSRTQVAVYYLAAALVLTVFSAAVGCAAGRLVESKVIDYMRELAGRYSGQDLRFSVSRLALIRTLEFSPTVPFTVYLAAAGTLIAGSAIFTLIFTYGVLREKKTIKRRAKKPAHISKTRTSRLSGPLKYALISIRRSLVRTAAVLLLAAAAALFFARLESSLAGYRAQLESYRDSARILSYATDYYGRKLDRLLLDPDTALEMMKRDVVKDCAVTCLTGYCTLVGVAITAEGERLDPAYTQPESEFGVESMEVSIMHDRPWVSTSSVENSPQFRYAKPEITWLEGFGEEDFLSGRVFCALSDTTMKDNGIKLGDCVMFYTLIKGEFGSWNLGRVILKVIASYSSASSVKTVLWPLTPNAIYSGDPYSNYEYWMKVYEDKEPFDPEEMLLEKVEQFTAGEWETEFTWEDEYGTHTQTIQVHRLEKKLSSFTFRLSDPARLDELRDTLVDTGYTWVGSSDRLHDHAVIEDEMYLNTVHSMERQIEYVSALYYALYILAGVIGFALAWLITSSRRKEIALMRALGTQKWRILLNFFTEQILLAALGLGIGLAISLALGGINTFALQLSCAFLILWSISALACLIVSLMKKARAALTEPE